MSKAVSDIAKVGIEFKDFSAVRDARVFKGVFSSVRDVSRRPVIGQRARIDFILQRNLDGVASEGDAADGCVARIDTCNAGEEEVCLREVESAGQDESRHGDGRVDFAFTDGELADCAGLGAEDAWEEH